MPPRTKGIMNQVFVAAIWVKCRIVVRAKRTMKMIAAGREGE